MSRKTDNAVEPAGGIPTVQFDVSRVTDDVKAAIKNDIACIEGIDSNQFDQIYGAAVRSVSAGQDLHLLCDALLRMNIDGMTKQRAAEIARLVNNRATAAMNRERRKSLGIKYAIWLYSGAPCAINPRNPTARDIRQDEPHRAANGKRFDISTGLFLDGKWTWPGLEDGCRCVSKSVISGFD